MIDSSFFDKHETLDDDPVYFYKLIKDEPTYKIYKHLTQNKIYDESFVLFSELYNFVKKGWILKKGKCNTIIINPDHFVNKIKTILKTETLLYFVTKPYSALFNDLEILSLFKDHGIVKKGTDYLCFADYKKAQSLQKRKENKLKKKYLNTKAACGQKNITLINSWKHLLNAELYPFFTSVKIPLDTYKLNKVDNFILYPKIMIFAKQLGFKEAFFKDKLSLLQLKMIKQPNRYRIEPYESLKRN